MSFEYIPGPVCLSLKWVLERPIQPLPVPILAVLCGGWSYGLIPYCGPGTRKALWDNEQAFLNALSSHLNGQGIYTLRLISRENGSVPDDSTLTLGAGHDGVLLALRDIEGPVIWTPDHMVFIGHGMGSYSCCQLASYGIRPGGYIFAGGIYSDLEVILSQKYLLPIELQKKQGSDEQSVVPDSLSLLISENMGAILQAIRKKRSRIQLQALNEKIEIRLNQDLYSGDETPRTMFRYITSPTLVIHGSSDLDVTVWNATSIEQVVRKNVATPERIILEDRDHWFRMVQGSIGRHMKDRVSGASFFYEQDERFLRECSSFIRRIYGVHEAQQEVLKRGSHLGHDHIRKRVPKESG
nr:alpha/beta hydrolase [uncultured Methanospirillum sp.]